MLRKGTVWLCQVTDLVDVGMELCIATQPHVQYEVYWVLDSATKLHAASATLAKKFTRGASKVCSQSVAIILAPLFVGSVRSSRGVQVKFSSRVGPIYGIRYNCGVRVEF